MALASVAVPWALYIEIPLDTLPKALAPAALWAALWPVLLGVALAVALDRLKQHLPSIPAGDVGIALGRFHGAVEAAGRAFERTDDLARRWPVACMALLLLSLMFGGALLVLD